MRGFSQATGAFAAGYSPENSEEEGEEDAFDPGTIDPESQIYFPLTLMKTGPPIVRHFGNNPQLEVKQKAPVFLKGPRNSCRRRSHEASSNGKDKSSCKTLADMRGKEQKETLLIQRKAEKTSMWLWRQTTAAMDMTEKKVLWLQMKEMRIVAIEGNNDVKVKEDSDVKSDNGYDLKKDEG
ncbi:hypothetical protein TURU_065669 [Turdus rufiventris]|nr:hypothetical protein TURU_065669 [Turdus rufiventris]